MKKIILNLDGITPEQLSMRRLSDYLRALAELYGSEDKVHFEQVRSGSAQLVSSIADEAYEGVIRRVTAAANDPDSGKIRSTYLKLNAYMQEDQVNGTLLAEGAAIIQFPLTATQEKPMRITKESSVQGRLYTIGGKAEVVSIRLEGANNESLMCETSVELAKELGPLLFSNIRLHGRGQWERCPNGSWKLNKLQATSYEVLSNSGFKGAVKAMKTAGGINWNNRPNAHMEILESR